MFPFICINSSSESSLSIAENIMWGTLSGVLASVILLFIGIVTTKIVLPWYQILIYKGIVLSDTWICDWTSDGSSYKFIMNVKQNAHTISGKATLTKTATDPKYNYVQALDISGKTWEGFVLLNMESQNPRHLTFITSMLKIVERGDILVGHALYRSASTEHVGQEELRFTRRGG